MRTDKGKDDNDNDNDNNKEKATGVSHQVTTSCQAFCLLQFCDFQHG